jgi:hypothetical protein
VFRPSVLTSWGTWRDLEGDFDGSILWVETKLGKRGIHVATRTEIEPLAQPQQQQGKKAA